MHNRFDGAKNKMIFILNLKIMSQTHNNDISII